MAITSPANRKPISVFDGILSFVFVIAAYTAINPTAMLILNHTNGNASRVIKAPNTAVNPHTNTMKWRCI
ncbi:hypothetical protein D3C86_1818770 [compost metagenome]